MKPTIAAFFFSATLFLSACTGSPAPKPLETIVVPATSVPTATATVPLAPTPTATATQTLTPAPTVVLSPTATPKNFVLAEKGYDIADVRLFFQARIR
jgi:hypothetical protein